MNNSPRQMKLGAFIYPTGHHVAAWRHPDSQADGGVNFKHYIELAQTAERGLFDMMFLADVLSGVTRQGEPVTTAARGSHFGHFEPLTLLSALAAVTEHLGLVATMTTTYNEPYHVARKFASLDLISGGRSGWNLVTSANTDEALNFSSPAHALHADRYERAREFAHVVQGLWDSWDEDAFTRDKASGLFFDPTKMRTLNHSGKHFSVRGPLNVPRSLQGAPVLVQAGSSDDGKDLAAETAEVVFTAQQKLETAQAFYADVKERAARYGRAPDDIKIMPGVLLIVGRTEEEARAKYQSYQELIHPDVGLMQLSRSAGVDLSGYDLDGPMPLTVDVQGPKSRFALISKLATDEGLTIRQLYMRLAGTRGHWLLVGSPAQIADEFEEWFVKRGADGFNILPALVPTGLNDIVNLLIPELQRRGLFRRAYEGRTLRENLGLRKPSNGWRFAAGTQTQRTA
ncbi:MAG: nitrilotriacetate monooxygenase [Alphaproteobacteria bacterium 64-6]|nr:MAG: nitrilotriacetate monooxygenase [Alphaproteobacteria bacterium 64-6]